MSSLNQSVKVVSQLDYASGSANRSGAVVDVAGFEGVMLQAHFAAVAAAVSIAVQHGDLPSGADMATLASTSRAVAPGDSNKVVTLDVYRPMKRYLRLAITKGGNTSAESAAAILYGPKSGPIADPYVTEHLSPAS